MIGHVVGPHWYLYRVPGLSNMTIVTIFLNPTCQSWPQLSQIVEDHDFMCKIEFSPPTTQVLIENMCAGFKMVGTILLGGQKQPFLA